ncbi:MAG: pilus assembly protein [Rhodospirillales bacterium]|jgi:Flp pilus assembly protein TadG|nr:pilus assembly protein [Rhodospirillales bacterium]
MTKNLLRNLRRLAVEPSGSIPVEFAFVVTPMVVLMIGIVEFGMILFTGILLESGLRDASRFGITGLEEEGASRMEQIVQIVSDHTLGLVDLSVAQFDVLVYPNYADIGRGEAFVDGNANGAYDVGETFTDENGNGSHDADVGTAGAGDSGDIVVYRIKYDWPLLTPFAGTFIGSDGTFPLRASIAVRNEPWETS